jgi:hypothetical protein
MEYIDMRRYGRCCSGRYLAGAGAGALAGRIAEMGGLVGYLIMLYYASRALRGLYIVNLLFALLALLLLTLLRL